MIRLLTQQSCPCLLTRNMIHLMPAVAVTYKLPHEQPPHMPHISALFLPPPDGWAMTNCQSHGQGRQVLFFCWCHHKALLHSSPPLHTAKAYVSEGSLQKLFLSSLWAAFFLGAWPRRTGCWLATGTAGHSKAWASPLPQQLHIAGAVLPLLPATASCLHGFAPTGFLSRQSQSPSCHVGASHKAKSLLASLPPARRPAMLFSFLPFSPSLKEGKAMSQAMPCCYSCHVIARITEEGAKPPLPASCCQACLTAS